jgi:acyl-CoA thioesterase YciA
VRCNRNQQFCLCKLKGAPGTVRDAFDSRLVGVDKSGSQQGWESIRKDMSKSKVQLPSDRLPSIKVAAMPKDANAGGSIFGGWILSQIDIAAAIPALERAKGRVATVAVNSVEFHQPVFVGDVISCYADIIKTGNTSITVKVEVYAERNPADKQIIKVTEAELTYVALDENRKPRKLPEV